MIKTAIFSLASLSFSSAASAQCVPTPDRICVGFSGAGYTINGLSRPTIELVRGQTYTFQMVSISGVHPFHLSTSSTGGGAGAGHWSQGVVPAVGGVSGNNTLVFTIPNDAPNILYYQCVNHSGLGGRINIVNPHCHADFNGDGFLDGFDYDDFVQCFEGGSCPSGRTADFNEDGFADGFDYDEFVAEFEMGCG